MVSTTRLPKRVGIRGVAQPLTPYRLRPAMPSAFERNPSLSDAFHANGRSVAPAVMAMM
jgi:hypothetical protein